MTLELSTQNNATYSAEQLELIKNMACKNSTDDEFKLFIEVCQRLRLNPFIKQIYSIKRGDQRTIQISIDGYRAVAERTGNYAPGREPRFDHDENKRLISATAYVMKRTHDGKWHEVAATAFYDEYRSTSGVWPKMPKAMLAKCAESIALRKAFPSEFSGTYSEEEMDQANKDDKSEKEIAALEVVEAEELDAPESSVKAAWSTLEMSLLFVDDAILALYKTYIEDRFKEKFPKKFNTELVKYIESCVPNAEAFAQAMTKWHSNSQKNRIQSKETP